MFERDLVRVAAFLALPMAGRRMATSTATDTVIATATPMLAISGMPTSVRPSIEITTVTPATVGKDASKNAKSGLKAAGFSGGIGCHAEDVGGYWKNVSWAQALFVPTVSGPKMRGGDSGGPVYTQDAKGNITVFGVDKGEL